MIQTSSCALLHRRLKLSWLLLYAVLIRPPRLLRESRQRVMLLSLLRKLGSTLVVPKLWLRCKLSPKVAVRQPLRLPLLLRRLPRHYLSSAPVPLCPRVTSAEAMHWNGQVSGDFARRDGDVFRLKSTTDQLLAFFESLQYAVAGDASTTENVEAMLQQFIDNFADQQPARRTVGTRGSAMSKSRTQLTTLRYGKYAPRKHWLLRERIPPIIGDSAADVQSFVGEAVNVTTAVATQLREISDFDVRANRPRAEGMVDHLLMLRFLAPSSCGGPVCWFFLRQRRVPPWPAEGATIDAAFASMSADLRRHTLGSNILLSGFVARCIS